MGKRGPKAETKIIQDLKGNPANRPRPEPVPADGSPNMPAWLDVDAMVIFNNVIAAMPPGFYSSADSEILAHYAVAASNARKAALEMQEYGITVDEEKFNQKGESIGYVKKRNPANAVWSDAVAKMATIGTRLGLDPAARQAITMPLDPDKEKANNGFGDLIGGKPNLRPIKGGKK